MPIRILVVDDHDVVREGVRGILARHPDWEVCGEAANGEEAVAAVSELQPDVTIMELTLPLMNGLAAAEQIVQSGSRTKILILTMHDPGLMLDGVKSIGAHGIVSKSRAGQDLIPAIEVLLSGGTFWPGAATSAGLN